MKLIIPESLQRFSNKQASIEISIDNLTQLQAGLKQALPELSDVIFRNDSLDHSIRLAINSEVLMSLTPDNPVTASDEVEILIALSGG